MVHLVKYEKDFGVVVTFLTQYFNEKAKPNEFASVRQSRPAKQ